MLWAGKGSFRRHRFLNSFALRIAREASLYNASTLILFTVVSESLVCMDELIKPHHLPVK